MDAARNQGTGNRERAERLRAVPRIIGLDGRLLIEFKRPDVPPMLLKPELIRGVLPGLQDDGDDRCCVNVADIECWLNTLHTYDEIMAAIAEVNQR